MQVGLKGRRCWQFSMNNFNALLSHQGSLKHVNHAHRQCAPTGVQSYDPDTMLVIGGDIQEEVMHGPVYEGHDPQKDYHQSVANASRLVSTMSDSYLRVNIALFQTKIAYIKLMHDPVSKLLPVTDDVSKELRMMTEQMAAAIEKLQALLLEQTKREQERVWQYR